MEDSRAEVTAYLERLKSGDAAALDQLLPIVYRELHQMAERAMRKERSGDSLQPTALVNEAYMRLVGSSGAAPEFENRRVFFGAAAEAMRRVLIDRARARNAEKRGEGKQAVTFHDLAVEVEEDVDLLALDEALAALEGRSPEMADAVKLRFFGGLSPEEAAEVLGVSESTFFRQWRFARAWLYERMSGVEPTA